MQDQEEADRREAARRSGAAGQLLVLESVTAMRVRGSPAGGSRAWAGGRGAVRCRRMGCGGSRC